MADKDETELENLLEDDDSTPDPSADVTLAKVLESTDSKMSSSTDSMSHMSDSIVELRRAPSATAKRDFQVVESNSPACDRQNRRKAQRTTKPVVPYRHN